MFGGRGLGVAVWGLVGMFVFSLCLVMSENSLMFWLFMELSGLCLVPTFFWGWGGSSLESLFNYLVVSSISSSLVLSGILWSDFSCFIYIGFLTKFGVFPLFGWVYRLLLGSSWYVIWLFSSLSKVPVFYFSFFLSGFVPEWGFLLVSFSFLFLGFVFWLYTVSWRHCWSHMMLSSSAAILLVSWGLLFDSLLILFFVYVVWASLVLKFFSCNDVSLLGLSPNPGGFFLYCWLLVSFPLSLSVFYKIVLGSAVFSFGVFCFFCWIIYSISEQLYLMSLSISVGVPTQLRGLTSVA